MADCEPTGTATELGGEESRAEGREELVPVLRRVPGRYPHALQSLGGLERVGARLVRQQVEAITSPAGGAGVRPRGGRLHLHQVVLGAARLGEHGGEQFAERVAMDDAPSGPPEPQRHGLVVDDDRLVATRGVPVLLGMQQLLAGSRHGVTGDEQGVADRAVVGLRQDGRQVPPGQERRPHHVGPEHGREVARQPLERARPLEFYGDVLREIGEAEPPRLLVGGHLLQHQRRRRPFADGGHHEFGIFGVAARLLHAAEVHVLVVERVRELVRENHPLDERRQPVGPIDEAKRPAFGFVVAGHLLVEHRHAGAEQIAVGRDETGDAQEGLDLRAVVWLVRREQDAQEVLVRARQRHALLPHGPLELPSAQLLDVPRHVVRHAGERVGRLRGRWRSGRRRRGSGGAGRGQAEPRRQGQRPCSAEAEGHRRVRTQWTGVAGLRTASSTEAEPSDQW